MATQRKVAERFCPIERLRNRKSLEASLVFFFNFLISFFLASLVFPQAWITSGHRISCLLSTESACESG